VPAVLIEILKKGLYIMLFTPFAISEHKLTKDELNADHKTLVKYGPCGVSQRALYLNVYVFDRVQYIPIKSVERVYKRLGVAKGFYESGKVFLTISYLVVVYDGGKEKVCRFTREEHVDQMLEHIRSHTKIPVGKLKPNK